MRSDSLAEIAQQLRKENDRSVAIIAASSLDLQLEKLLSKSMIDHKDIPKFFEGYAPLSTLSAKASMALFLGLIPPDIFNDLNYIRKIRNEFAHKHYDVGFSHSPVLDFVSNLISVKWWLHCLPLMDKPMDEQDVDEIRAKPRRKFEISVAIVSLFLDEYIDGVQKAENRKDQFHFPSIS